MVFRPTVVVLQSFYSKQLDHQNEKEDIGEEQQKRGDQPSSNKNKNHRDAAEEKNRTDRDP